MEKDRAVPPGYMTVGEMAKKMDVTVRTLQHYDKMGLLSPSALSEGGRRLYTDKDVVRLYQILSLKRLGFSLEDIRDRLTALDTPEEVAQVLSEQAGAVRRQIASLQSSLEALEALEAEVRKMQSVDFRIYADIIVNLEMHNDFYWLIKHFDDETLDQIRNRFDKESSQDFIERLLHLQDQAIRLSAAGTREDDPESLAFAAAYWDLVTEFTGGDPSLLPKLVQLAEKSELTEEWTARQGEAKDFTERALGAYFAAQGTDPFGGSYE